jgi:hypothetical protein
MWMLNQLNDKPLTKRAVIKNIRAGRRERMVFWDRIGCPAFKNASSNPPRPITAPPRPTRANPAGMAPRMLRKIGRRNIIKPAIPWTTAKTIVAILPVTENRVITIAVNPTTQIMR